MLMLLCDRLAVYSESSAYKSIVF